MPGGGVFKHAYRAGDASTGAGGMQAAP
jgi:hypothetical protein